jgi:hypothetical protein
MICGESVINSNSPLSYKSPSRQEGLCLPPDEIFPKVCNAIVSELVCLVGGAIILCAYYKFNPGVTHVMISLGDRVLVLKTGRKARC